MTRIEQATIDQDQNKIKELFWEYLSWANSRLNELYQIDFDISTMLKNDMENIQKYFPPAGQLFLAYQENHPVGIACMKKISEEAVEIKRMYVRPEFRGKGVGSQLLEWVINKAQQENYKLIRLDTNLFMKPAQLLYQSFGFDAIGPYPESEIPPEFHRYWIFMEKKL